MNRREILVTGGTGLLGSRVVVRLSEAGEGVRVMSRYRRANTVRGDLLTEDGLEAAVEGIGTIIHCASSPIRPRQVDVTGTERLLRVATRAGVSHVVFISIVGVDRNPYFPYYRMKLETERTVEQASMPWTILRATQFHEFVLRQIRFLELGPVALAPKGFLLQPIDTGEVADRLVELALSEPAGRAPDVGGPEAKTFADLARSYQKAAGRYRKLLEVPIPGKTARALRLGAQTNVDRRYGRVTWEEFLNRTVSRSQPEEVRKRAGMNAKYGERPTRRT
jgi:uncharacterized protein YbjT (DUF2867 family)